MLSQGTASCRLCFISSDSREDELPKETGSISYVVVHIILCETEDVLAEKAGLFRVCD